MKKTELNNYVIFKFYIPDYHVQGRPIPIKASLVKKYGWRWALNKAKDNFLLYGLKPIGDVTPKQEDLWEDGKITWDARNRKLSSKQIKFMRETQSGSRIGWKRLPRYGRRRH